MNHLRRFLHMGNDQSSTSGGMPAALPEHLWCSICYDTLAVDEFRVLNCGHYFCWECMSQVDQLWE